MKTSLGLTALLTFAMAASGTALAATNSSGTSTTGVVNPVDVVSTFNPAGNIPAPGYRPMLPGSVAGPYQPLGARQPSSSGNGLAQPGIHEHDVDQETDQDHHHGWSRHVTSPGSAQQHYVRQRARSVQAKLRRLDTNHDGKLSRTEAAASPALTALFDSIDSNHDGYLTAAEIIAWMQQHQAGSPTQSTGSQPGGSPAPSASHPGMLRTINGGTCTGLPIGAC